MFSTLYRKAKAYEAGERIEFGGKTYPPLYTPRNSTLLALFDVRDEELAHLKTIIPKEVAAERDRGRHRKAMDRPTYLETAQKHRVEARLRRDRGESLRQIATVLGVSLDTVKTYLYRNV